MTLNVVHPGVCVRPLDELLFKSPLEAFPLPCQCDYNAALGYNQFNTFCCCVAYNVSCFPKRLQSFCS